MTPNASGNGIWAVVPVKRFDRAKARLAGLLDRAARISLARAMLGDVLEQLTCTQGLAGAIVVTGDGEAAAMAQAVGANVVPDPTESGMNDAVLRGARAVDRLGGSGMVVVPGDLPFATSDEFHAVLIALARAPVVIVPAMRDRGTNVLALSPTGIMAPAFGDNSFERHVSVAAAKGLRPAFLVLDGAGHDIDTVDDLALDARLRAGARTRAWLDGSSVGAPRFRADVAQDVWS